MFFFSIQIFFGLGQRFLPMKTIFVISERVAALCLVVAIVADIAGVLNVFALHVLYHVVLLNAATKTEPDVHNFTTTYRCFQNSRLFE